MTSTRRTVKRAVKRPVEKPLSWSGLLVLSLVALFACDLCGQTVKLEPTADSPPPPLTYRGLIPGVSSVEQVREVLGEPLSAARWYAFKFLYAAPGRPGHFDALHLKSRDGKKGILGNVEAASVPDGWATWKDVRAKLGEPEYYLEFHRQSFADYSARGLRWTFDRAGRTIGIAYVPHGRTRVPAGARHFLSLRHLRQGPQPTPTSPAELGGLKVGAAEADLTPQQAAWLGPQALLKGFKVRDPLKARCAVIERDGLKLALVGADLFGMSFSEVEPIQEELGRHGIDHMILAMSHNHAAADTIGVYGFFPLHYVEYIQKQVVKGVLEAAKNAQPVKRWVAASDELPLDGARVEGLFRNARNPGIVDPQMAVLQAVGMDEKPIATFVHFACHVEGLENGVLETSADFPGYLCDRLAKELGGVAIFLNGALGGMVSGDTRARTHAEAKIAGERLAEETLRILKFAVPPSRMPFTVDRYPIELPLTNPKFILLMEKTGRRKLRGGRILSEMYLVRLGDAEMVTIPGELLPEVSYEILEAMQGYPRLIVGLANDELGYLIPGYDFRAGEYEESMSVGPAGGPMMREQAIRMLQRRYRPQRFGERDE